MDLEHYRALVEHGPSMLWRTRVDGQRSYVNAAWLAFTGRTKDAVIGGRWDEGVHPDDVERTRAVFRDHFERRAPFAVEYRLRRADGGYGSVLDRGAPHHDETGAFDGFIGSCTHIEGRDVSFGAHDFFEMSLDNVCVAGLEGYFKRVNPSWTRTLGWTAEELMAKPSLEFVHPEDREAVLAGRQRLGSGAPLGRLINRYLCKDGTHRWLEWRSVADVERGLVYATARDITEQKEAEERLQQAKEMQAQLQSQLVFADRMASVGTLAAGVGHEINNPLAGITATVAVMIEELAALAADAPSERVQELKDMALEVQVGAERIRKIVLGLKTFARIDDERRVAIDVRPLLDLSIDMTLNELRNRAQLVKDYGATPLVEADEARLGQVFVNLLVNAAHAIPKGDRAANVVRVTTSTDAAGRAVIEVADTGQGVPAHMIEQIFEPFFTTKPVGSGTGLGLSICHSIVTTLGGEITVESEEGRGTTFRVLLPAAQNAP